MTCNVSNGCMLLKVHILRNTQYMASIERILNSGAKKCEENDGVGQGMDTLGHELDEWCLQ